MPDEYYNSIYTGEEIDRRLGLAGEVADAFFFNANSTSLWESGAISSSSGANSSSTTRIRTTGYIGAGAKRISIAAGYKYMVFGYNAGTYMGTWNGTSFVKSGNWRTTETDLTALPAYDFRLVMAYIGDGTITTTAASNITLSASTDTTLSVSGAAADAKATGDAVNEGKSALRYVEDASEISLNPVFTQGKNISSTGAFVSNVSRIATKGFIDIANARTANSIPIADNAYKEGISYTIANGYRIYVAYYSEPNESSFVSSEGWLTGSGKLTPTGNYMRLGYATVGDASTMTVAMASNITLKVQYSLKSVLEKLNHWGVTYNGSLTTSDDADNIVDIGIRAFNSRFSTSIPKTGSGSLITIPGIGVEAQSSSTITALLQMCIYIDGEIWIRYARYASSSYSWRAWVKIHSGIEKIVEPTKWLAVGDSITYGVYSYIGSGGVAGSAVTPDCWVRLLANSLSYDLTIMASRGMGYTVTGQDPDDSSLPRITLDALLTRIEAMTDDFNLITLAFGINDYATTTSTVSGVVTSFNDAVERLSEKFPEARLVVITPFNSCRAGTASSNWAYNTASGNKTLKDVADAIAERCSAYGIECIDASNGFLLNSFNIQDLLPDSTHPSLIAHKLIAKNMAHLLLN